MLVKFVSLTLLVILAAASLGCISDNYKGVPNSAHASLGAVSGEGHRWHNDKLPALVDTYTGGSSQVFISGSPSPLSHIVPDPVRSRELKIFLSRTFRDKYDDHEIIYEYSYNALHSLGSNTKYTISCFCFPSVYSLCSCDNFARTTASLFMNTSAGYLQYAKSDIFYVEDDSTPDDRFMNILSFSLYVNGTFPSSLKMDEIWDFENWLAGGVCFPTISKRCACDQLPEYFHGNVSLEQR